MKKNIFIIFIICFLILINNSKEINVPYSQIATDFLGQYTENIIAVKSKTNKTKCYAIKDIKINDIIFEYDKEEIISSETCFHPQKKEVLKNITNISNNTYEQNELLLSFCIYYVLLDPDSVEELPKKKKFYIISLPINKIHKNELFFNNSDFNEFLITGNLYPNFEQDILDKILKNDFGIKDKNNDLILFSKIFYFIKIHSFNINNNAVILPFMDICDIVPYYLSKPNIDNINPYLIEEKENKIIVKSTKNFQQTDQYVFSFKNPIDNDYLMLKSGIVIHNNLYDKYSINKSISFKNKEEYNELLKNLKNYNISNLIKYYNDNSDKAKFEFELLGNKKNEILNKFGKAYFNYWSNKHNNKGKFYKNIDKQALIFILRICYDELKKIKNKIKMNFDEYIIKAQKSNISKIPKFNLEKTHLLLKNINYTYKDLVIYNYDEIKKQKDNYIN